MNPIFQKLNYKPQAAIIVLNAPDAFSANVEEMQQLTTVVTSPQPIRPDGFVLAFVTTQTEVNQLTAELTELLTGDGLLWFAYPKATSKKHTCDFNRDTGWNELYKRGFEPVRMVAIDEDWCALRFRRQEFVKK